MAFTELIKNYRRIREYLREFYVYGFRSRDGFARQSGRSYDDERRRVESYLKDYCGFRYTESGKVVFLSIDSRSVHRNPLYRPWKSKSFTDLDITLHFILLDLLREAEGGVTLQEILAQIDEYYLGDYEEPICFDESSLRKKLKEYVQLGLVEQKKQGKQVWYRSVPATDLSGWWDAIAYFSEVAPCGVLGSYLLDWQEEKKELFSFKHHYITHAMESEILCQLFDRMGRHEAVGLKMLTRRNTDTVLCAVVPLRVMYSAQSGRCHLLGYHLQYRQMWLFRVDHIEAVYDAAPWETPELTYEMLMQRVQQMRPHLWGVSLGNHRSLENISMTITAGPEEAYIPRRLIREKRFGTVEQLDDSTWRFTAEVYDVGEMLPWLRTWICRIREMTCTNEEVLQRFWRDYETTKAWYLGNNLQTTAPNQEETTLSERRPPQNGFWQEASTEVASKWVSDKEAKEPSLFHEIWGCYYQVVGKLLGEAVSRKLTTAGLKDLVGREAFEESVPAIWEAFTEKRWQLMQPQGEKAYRGDTAWHTALRHKPTLQLTTLQKRWLKSICLDKRLPMFLGEEADTQIKTMLQALEEVEPLYTPQDYELYDVYGDGDPYGEETYQQVFRQLRDATRQEQAVYLEYRAVSGQRKGVTGIPVDLEYSEKDDKFRVNVRTKRGTSTLNVAGIMSCRSLGEAGNRLFRLEDADTEKASEKGTCKCTLVMKLWDERNALDRVLLHFAHFEKQAEQLGEKEYEISLVYDREDETEVLIRVLSFGPMLRVVSPENFVTSVKKRFERQEQCGKEE